MLLMLGRWRNSKRSRFSFENSAARKYLSGVYHFSFRELELATNGFSEGRRLGMGGFGTVYAGILSDGRIVAVKLLNCSPKQASPQFLSEVAVLSQFNHPALVQLIGCSLDGHALVVVYEFVSNGTLWDHLHGAKKHKLPWPTRLGIAIEISTVLTFLHSFSVFHRDIKSSNVLLDESFHAKLGDFGLSRFSVDESHVTTEPQGTAGYLDPEYHHCYQLTDKSDVYSFGVLLMELITAKAAVDLSRDKKLVNLASYSVAMIQAGAFEDIIDPHLNAGTNNRVRETVLRVAEIAFQCLAVNREDRPCMEDIAARLISISRQ